MIRFATQTTVVLLLLGTAGSAISFAPQTKNGTFQNRIYHHTATGTEIRLPAHWSILGDMDSSGGGEAVTVKDKSGQRYLVWMISSSTAAEGLPAALEHDADYKVQQRAAHGVQLNARPGTLRKWHVEGGNAQALSVAFDIGQVARIEYDTWVRTSKTLVYFTAMVTCTTGDKTIGCSASDIRSIQDRSEILVRATVVP